MVDVGGIFQGLGKMAGAGNSIYYLASGQAEKDNDAKIQLEKLKLDQVKVLSLNKPLDTKTIILIVVVVIILIAIIKKK